MLNLYRVTNASGNQRWCLANNVIDAISMSVKFGFCKNITKLDIKLHDPIIFNEPSKVQDLKRLMEGTTTGFLSYCIDKTNYWIITPV